MQAYFPFQFRRIGRDWYLWRNESWRVEWRPVYFLLQANSTLQGYFGFVDSDHQQLLQSRELRRVDSGHRQEN
ncbi:hypothetical protein [Thermococcus sp.]|uniref:hypothetical protein n=1 Tax=Thermococcus sp. TaxID=35749 RepID=UPI00260620D0|nr:hypothetical protein [Thermococcus sp.]